MTSYSESTAEDVIGMSPVPVHVTGMEAAVSSALGGVFGRRKRKQYSVVPHTVTLTSDTPADQLCRPDPNRVLLMVIAFTNAVVISRTKGEAQAAGNVASSITAPNGSMIPSGVLLKFPCTSELWASTGSYPTLVSVFEIICAP